MTRTLEEMKRSRGGHCLTCKKDIMSEEEKDHTFCNDCWDANLAHPFEEDDSEGCQYCDEQKTHRSHDLKWANEYLKQNAVVLVRSVKE